MTGSNFWYAVATPLVWFVLTGCAHTSAADLGHEFGAEADIHEAQFSNHFSGDELGDVISAWNQLAGYKDTLSDIGYTLQPYCFGGSRYETPTTLTLHFAAKNPGPEGCSAYGSFVLRRNKNSSTWHCTVESLSAQAEVSETGSGTPCSLRSRIILHRPS